MKIVYFDVGQNGRVIEIKGELSEYQQLVGDGYIETFRLFSVGGLNERLVGICNDEGKIRGMPYNRQANEFDYICGPFLIVGRGDEDFCGVSEQDASLVCKLYDNLI